MTVTNRIVLKRELHKDLLVLSVVEHTHLMKRHVYHAAQVIHSLNFWNVWSENTITVFKISIKSVVLSKF